MWLRKQTKDGISKVSNILDYKFKVIHLEYDTLDLLPTKQYDNTYHRVYNNCGDDYGTVIPYSRYLCDTVILENIYLSSNKITEIIYLVPSVTYDYVTYGTYIPRKYFPQWFHSRYITIMWCILYRIHYVLICNRNEIIVGSTSGVCTYHTYRIQK